MQNNIKNAIKNTICDLLNNKAYISICEQQADGNAFIEENSNEEIKSNQEIKEVIQQQKNYIIKQYNLNELNDIQPIGFFQKDLEGNT